jgi:hypothetical protein
MPSRKFVRLAGFVRAIVHVLILLTIFVPIFLRVEVQPVPCVSGRQAAFCCCTSCLIAEAPQTMTR